MVDKSNKMNRLLKQVFQLRELFTLLFLSTLTFSFSQGITGKTTTDAGIEEALIEYIAKKKASLPDSLV